MKKRIPVSLLMLFVIILCGSIVQAYDFTDMNNSELYEFRPSLKYANEDERQTYWREWDKRVKMMSAQEKEKYKVNPTKNNKIKFLYSPGMGYEGPISTPEDIYGSATRPVYKPIEERQIYGISPEEEKEGEEAETKEEPENK